MPTIKLNLPADLAAISNYERGFAMTAEVVLTCTNPLNPWQKYFDPPFSNLR